MRRLAVRVVPGLVCLLLSTPAISADTVQDISVLERPYPYRVVEQDLGEVLREFGLNLGIGVEVSRRVSGVVRDGGLPADTAGEFLQRIGQAHKLAWYLDSGVLFVSTQRENHTEVIPVGQPGLPRAREVARQWSERGDGVRVAVDPVVPGLLVTGPPAFRSRVLSSLSGDRPRPVASTGDGGGVMVYRGGAGGQRVQLAR